MHKLAQALGRGGNWLINQFLLLLIIVFLFLAGYFLASGRDFPRDTIHAQNTLAASMPVPDSGVTGFKAMHAMNPDVCAWLTIGNAGVQAPVLYSAGNSYAHRDAAGYANAAGSVALHKESSLDFSTFYSLIYNFSYLPEAPLVSLTDFSDKAYFFSGLTVTLETLEETFILQPVAFIRSYAYDNFLFSPHVSCDDQEGFLAYIREVSILLQQDLLSSDGRYVALSTAESEDGEARIVVLTRILNEKENDL